MPLDTPKCPDDEPSTTSISRDNFVDESSELNRFVDDFFVAVLDLPKCLKSFTTSVCGDEKLIGVEQLQLSIRNFVVPTISIPTHKQKFVGATRSESSKSISEFEEQTIQFKLDSNLHNYNILYKWLRMLADPATGKMSEYNKGEYETVFSVLLLDEYEKPVGVYTFSGVFPTALGSISLDYTTSESVFLDFTFSFDFLSFELNPNY